MTLLTLLHSTAAATPTTGDGSAAPVTYTVTSGDLTRLSFNLDDQEVTINFTLGPYVTTSLEIQQFLDTLPLARLGITKS